MRKEKYLLDGHPVDASALIKAAADLDSGFAADWLKQTSVAAHILREAGHSVDDNPDYYAE